MKVSSHTWVKKSPSILLFTSRGAPFHLPCCQQAQARASFFSLAPNTAHTSSAPSGSPTIPCPAPRCSHTNDRSCCSTAYQHTTQCQVPLLGTTAVHRKGEKFTATSLCALATMTHSPHTWLGHHEPSWLPRPGLSLNPAASFCYLLFMIFSAQHWLRAYNERKEKSLCQLQK